LPLTANFPGDILSLLGGVGHCSTVSFIRLNKNRTRKEVLVFTGNGTQVLADLICRQGGEIAKLPSFHFKGVLYSGATLPII